MRRRDFISVIAGATAWPLAARGQPAMPVVGYLETSAPAGMADLELIAPFRQGLAEARYVEGKSVAIPCGDLD